MKYIVHLDNESEKSKRELYKVLKQLPPGEYSININKYSRIHSAGQRGYYRGYLLPELELFTGYSTDELHEILTNLYLKQDVQIRQFVVERVQSTASLSFAEANKYYENVRRWAYHEWGIVLRLPNETGPLPT